MRILTHESNLKISNQFDNFCHFAHDLSNTTHALFESKQKESARKAYLKMADHSSSSSSESEFEENALLLMLLLRCRHYRRFES